MASWRKQLPHNPIPLLLDSGCTPVVYFSRRDLLDENPGPVEQLWELPDAQKITRKQLKSGRWKYPPSGAAARSPENYDQLETYRNLGFLVEKFGLTRAHPAIPKAAAYLFACQTAAGDFRGIYGTQYTPNYSAAIMELLIKAGYGRDRRIARGLRWLLSVRQADGGWAIPFRTAVAGKGLTDIMRSKKAEPDRTRPFSHVITGVVLRAFAAGAGFRGDAEIVRAGRLLASRFFKSDSYVDRRTPGFWTGFSFPFWFTDLLSALDALSRLGFSAEDPDVRKGLDWFTSRQRKDGGWTLKIQKGKDKALPYWLDLAVCRVFRRFYSG
ncbi:MAG: hypothetical protein JW748_14190 [Anaerolineales bacterium]|nr:hypothetical protein [Anaerolineales bacterium]